MNKRIVMGVIGHDIHVVSNRIIEIALRENGYDVCNIGVNNIAQNFLEACIEFDASVVVFSSLNGEARHWCKEVGEIFKRGNKSNVLKYIGGNLVVGEFPVNEINQEFINYGFDRVFHRPESIGVLIDQLSLDVK